MTATEIYLAGRYSRKNELRERAEELEACGFVVTSSWLKENYDPNVQLKEITDEDNRDIARWDVRDIARSDALVFFAEDQNAQPPRGGRHVEFGYALAKGLQLFVIGAKENIFHYLSDVKVYPTWRDFMLAECFG